MGKHEGKRLLCEDLEQLEYRNGSHKERAWEGVNFINMADNRDK